MDFIHHPVCPSWKLTKFNLYLNRVIIGVGFLLFSLAVLYVVYKRIGLLTLQRKVTEAIKAGMVGQAELRPQAVADDLNLHQVRGDCVHNAEAPLEQRIHDELWCISKQYYHVMCVYNTTLLIPLKVTKVKSILLSWEFEKHLILPFWELLADLL